MQIRIKTSKKNSALSAVFYSAATLGSNRSLRQLLLNKKTFAADSVSALNLA